MDKLIKNRIYDLGIAVYCSDQEAYGRQAELEDLLEAIERGDFDAK